MCQHQRCNRHKQSSTTNSISNKHIRPSSWESTYHDNLLNLKQTEKFIALRGRADQSQNLAPVPRHDAIESIAVDPLDHLRFDCGESSACWGLGR